MSGGDDRPAGKVPVADARKTTDSSLESERREVDQALDAKLARTEAKTDARIEETRDEVDARLEAAKAAAEAEAEAEHIAAEAEEALEKERRRVDALTEQEREKHKRDFHEVIAEERGKTDEALKDERGTSDTLVRTRDEALGLISHDLRNYLNVVAMKAEVVRRAAHDPAKVEKLASDIAAACKTMSRWASDLVDLSAIETGSISLDRRAVDLRELIRASVRDYAAPAAKKGLALEARVPDDAPPVFCDPERVVQILANLLDNAVKFADRPGTVTVGLEAAPAGSIVISVADSGPGIAAEHLEKVFARSWHARKGAASGTGLGLYIARQIAVAHGGDITVESELGQGATFRLTIPATRPAGDPA